jgi:aldehyde dehydrogenase family 7 protein A1
LCGPLHSKWQIEIFKNGLEEIKKQGGKVLAGGNVIEGPGNYVQPTLVEIDSSAKIL